MCSGKMILVALSIALIVGCATTTTTTKMYTGEELPEEKISVIRGSSGSLRVRVVAVDDEWVNCPQAGTSHGVEVLPGKHQIRAIISRHTDSPFPLLPFGWVYFGDTSLGGRELELNVEAGHKYKIEAKEASGKNAGFIIVVDTNTGEEISRNPLGPRF